MKIETLNPAIGQPLDGRVGCAHQLLAGTARPTTVLPKETVGTAHPTTDNITISIPFPSSEKNISSLLSDLIKILNQFENSPESTHPGINPFAKGGLLNIPPLLKGGEGGFVESLFYKGEEPLSFLKNFIENSGLLYEAKIAKGDIIGLEDDLKGLLLKLVEGSEKVGADLKPAPTVNSLLNDIEAKQLLNAKGKDEGVFYLHIPVLLPQGASTAEVQVRRDGKGNGEYKGDSHRIGFSIELREAGLISVDALVSRKGRDVTCYVSTTAENAEFLEFMNAHLPELFERLSGYGMRVEVK